MSCPSLQRHRTGCCLLLVVFASVVHMNCKIKVADVFDAQNLAKGHIMNHLTKFYVDFMEQLSMELVDARVVYVNKNAIVAVQHTVASGGGVGWGHLGGVGMV